MKITYADCIEVYFPLESDNWRGCINNIKWLRERGWKLWGIVDVGMHGLNLRRTAWSVYVPDCTKT